MTGWILIIIGSLLVIGAVIFFVAVELRLAKQQRCLVEKYEAQQEQELLNTTGRGANNV